MSLKGAKELKARLNATRLTFKLGGREWADETAEVMRPMVPSKTGKLRASFRRKSATKRRAQVGGWYTAFFISAGTVAHPIAPRNAKALVFKGPRGTIFAKKVNHPATRAQPFRRRAAQEGLRRKPMSESMIRLWNRAG